MRKASNINRLLSLVLCICMVLSMMPASALSVFAADGTTGTDTDTAAAYAEGDVASVTVGGTTTSYDTFGAAITAVQSCTAADKAVVTLLADIALGDTYQKIEGGVFTIDLNALNCPTPTPASMDY